MNSSGAWTQTKDGGTYPHGAKYMKRNVKARSFTKGRWTIEIHNPVLNTKRVHTVDNLTPDVMLVALAVQLDWQNPPLYNIGYSPYIAVGDNGATPAAGDTTLGNELERRLVAVQTRTTTVNQYSVFFNAGELLGNYREIGLFMDGNTSQATSSADTGILASRVQEDFTVGTGETVTISFDFGFVRP